VSASTPTSQRRRLTGSADALHRVGIDIVDVQDVRSALFAYGDRYLRRVFTADEVRDCSDHDGIAAERLAARFAAKEAVIKVLRPDDTPVPWRTIETVRSPGGWVGVHLTGNAARLADEAGLGELCLSITHERDLAAATVLASFQDPDSERPTCTTPSARS
jgi:holo-[acyl-carrier protein] synthase